MIITPDDLVQVDAVLDRERRLTRHNDLLERRGVWALSPEYRETPWGDTSYLPAFFAERPHLLTVLGFDEFVIFDKDVYDRNERYSVLSDRYAIPESLSYSRESTYREAASGAWYLFEGIRSPNDVGRRSHLHFVGPDASSNKYVTITTWRRRLETLARQPDVRARTLWLPGLWTTQLQRELDATLESVARPLLRTLLDGGTQLREVPWRHLEYLVAELLRDRGLEVYVTPPARDGGRDIVARGELIPGEPVELAVEVKQKATVGISDVQRALKANEDYPSLLVATAGRFSSGVLFERLESRSRLRLLLKDGIALSQWIDAYASRRGWAMRQRAE